MRYLFFPLLLTLSALIWANDTNLIGSTEEESWQTQCFGRIQVDMPAGRSWFNQSVAVTPSTSQMHPPVIWSGKYGRDPLHSDTSLVNIEVSQAVTREAWYVATNHFIPDKGAAQQRVIQNQMDELDARIRALSDDRSAEATVLYRQLIDQESELRAKMQHIGKVSSDLLMMTLLIQQYEEEGRDASRLKESLPELLAEDAKYPTDELFEREYVFDTGLPNTRAISRPSSLFISHWQANRVYTFYFGADTDTWKPQPASTQETLEPAALDFLSRFRVRAEDEIPDEPGVCIPFGFIADSGHEPFDFGYAWRPAGNRSMVYRIDQPASKELVSMALRRLIPNPNPRMGSVDRFGPTDVTFGYREGSLVGTRYQPYNRENPEEVIPETYHLVAEASARGPVPSVSMEFKTNREGGEFPPFDQAEAEFKQILQSFRPIPGIARLMNEETQSANEADESAD